MSERKKLTKEDVSCFMEGHDPEERIVNMEYSYGDNFIKVYYRDENDNRCMSERPFYPFLWATEAACQTLKKYVHENNICGGNLKALMNRYNIAVKPLRIADENGKVIDAMDKGYKFLFYATSPMSSTDFQAFFKKAGNPIYDNKKGKSQLSDTSKKEKKYFMPTPVEQYLISTGKRFFKGYNDYDDTLRMIFDLETTGLDTKKDRIDQFGIRFNRPVKYKGQYITFEKVYEVEGETEEEKNKSEYLNIRRFLSIVMTFQPDIITAHNGENFDWNMIIDALTRLGYDMSNLSKEYFNGQSIYKSAKETILKLGGEIEKFFPTIVPKTIVTDSLHAVRRAQAIDSNMKEAGLKYATKYAKIAKPNRVYVPGSDIGTIWRDETDYAFNDKNGDWYKIDDSHPLKDGYEIRTGHYVVMRYLLDDLWECDKVELKYNTTNFLICKILPLPFSKCCTMGTAGQWKALLTAWSYENDLAIPMSEDTGKFTGGLSRLLCTGFIKNVIKLDYNSLYPSIILTWGIEDEKDLDHAMLNFLEYVLTTREQSKALKKKAGKIVDKYEERINNGETLTEDEEKEYHQAQADYAFNDKKQSQQKVLGNSFFGAFGSNNGSVYPWKSIECAERTTCTGRQSLRLMISHFNNLGYKPIVGDSFTPDTPMFIKYNDSGLIDIKPISELINESEIKIDELGREYDYSKKGFKVLCRSGWMEPSYIYRHKTDKDIYEVSDGGMRVEVTEDHSLFNSDKVKIKPSEIDENTELEYYNGKIAGNAKTILTEREYVKLGAQLGRGEIDRVPIKVLNSYRKTDLQYFYNSFISNNRADVIYSKTCLAGLQYIKKMIN